MHTDVMYSCILGCSPWALISRIQRDGQAADGAATQVLEGLAQTGELSLEDSEVRVIF